MKSTRSAVIYLCDVCVLACMHTLSTGASLFMACGNGDVQTLRHLLASCAPGDIGFRAEHKVSICWRWWWCCLLLLLLLLLVLFLVPVVLVAVVFVGLFVDRGLVKLECFCCC